MGSIENLGTDISDLIINNEYDILEKQWMKSKKSYKHICDNIGRK